MAALDRQIWPFLTGQFGRSALALSFPEGCLEMDGVEIRSSLAALFDVDKTCLLKLIQPAPDAAFSVSHIVRQAFLAGKTLIEFPGILE